jgi:RNA polymerase sigma-70 factor, ECF subfamily
LNSADEAMDQYARGDGSAFDAVYEEVAPRLERYLRGHMRDQAAVEDVIQQTFLQMHGARGTFIAGAEVMPWALAIARRLMIDFGRRIRREEPRDLDRDDLSAGATGGTTVASGEEMVRAQEAGARLSAAYAQLSGPQRAAFDLVKTQGLSHAEAASLLRTTVTGIKLRVHRAYVALRGAAAGEPSLPAPASHDVASPVRSAADRRPGPRGLE